MANEDEILRCAQDDTVKQICNPLALLIYREREIYPLVVPLCVLIDKEKFSGYLMEPIGVSGRIYYR